MKKLLAWSMALLCMASLAGCAERAFDQPPAATQGDGDASEFDTYTVTANYDYGMHRPGLATILYNSSTAFFELPEGVDMVLAGDLFTVQYSGQLLVQESYPSSVVFADGGIESVTMQKAKLVRLTYHPAADGEAERFVVLHDNGIEEEIPVAERPDYYITDAEGHFEPLGELDHSQELFGSYSPVDGYSESDGYKFSGFYGWNPRFEEINDISELISVEEDESFLILPISKSKVSVWDEHTQYLDDIDLDLLKSAEEKLRGEISQYSNNSAFYLQIDEGCLCLAVEVIVQVQTDPSESADNDEAGCIDHEHKFFSERITK